MTLSPPVAAVIAAQLACIALALALLVRKLRFVLGSYRVQGRVVSESSYRMYGRAMRLYRVEFQLRNGQRAELRSNSTSARRPCVGEPVPVRVRERAGRDPKARIATWRELWQFTAIACVGSGLVALLLGAFVRAGA